MICAMDFDPDRAVQELIRLALAEDGVNSDVTTKALVDPTRSGRARIVARRDGIVAGLRLLQPDGPLTLAAGPQLRIEVFAADGAPVLRGQELARMEGQAARLLAMERVTLNFLQRMSGIATLTARYVTAAGEGGPAILETRKTCPGFRVLDKEAVRLGGGKNHRMGLHDMVLIKENHLACMGIADRPTAVRAAILAARQRAAGLAIEIEVEDLAQFDAALAERPDIIMLDDFDDASTKIAVDRARAASAPRPLIEVSGGITLERIPRLASLGVDRISVGALTHSVQAMDLAIDLELEGSLQR